MGKNQWLSLFSTVMLLQFPGLSGWRGEWLFKQDLFWALYIGWKRGFQRGKEIPRHAKGDLACDKISYDRAIFGKCLSLSFENFIRGWEIVLWSVWDFILGWEWDYPDLVNLDAWSSWLVSHLRGVCNKLQCPKQNMTDWEQRVWLVASVRINMSCTTMTTHSPGFQNMLSIWFIYRADALHYKYVINFKFN